MMANGSGLHPVVGDRMTPARDLLTGMPNRALFSELYRYAVGRSERLGLPVVMLSCELSQLTEIERSHDSPVVDSARRFIASRIRGLMRPSDIPARVGSNDFVVVLTDFEHFEDVAEITDAVRSELAKPFRVLGCDVEIRPSVEVVRDREAGVSIEHPALNVIDLRDDQLISHFQPIIDVGDGSVAGAEALLRWAHPSYGILTAGQFFGTAECSTRSRTRRSRVRSRAGARSCAGCPSLRLACS